MLSGWKRTKQFCYTAKPRYLFVDSRYEYAVAASLQLPERLVSYVLRYETRTLQLEIGRGRCVGLIRREADTPF